MNVKILDPARDEDYANIMLHDVPVVLKKERAQVVHGPIKLGDKRGGKVKELKVGKPLTLEGTQGTTTSELEAVQVNDVIGSIALKTRNSVYSIGMADESKKNRQVSLKFLRLGYLDFDDKMPDGFYDGGRYTKFHLEGDKMTPRSVREIIVLHEGMDPALQKLLTNAKSFLGNVADLETRIKMLAMFVSNTMGGSQIYKHPENDLEKLCEREIKDLTDKSPDKFMPIGYLTHGVCRHRSLLFKYLADRLGIPSRLVRGDIGGHHQWNVAKLGGKYYIVDVMLDPTQLLEENSPEAKLYQRKGLNGLRGGFGGRSVLKT